MHIRLLLPHACQTPTGRSTALLLPRLLCLRPNLLLSLSFKCIARYLWSTVLCEFETPGAISRARAGGRPAAAPPLPERAIERPPRPTPGSTDSSLSLSCVPSHLAKLLASELVGAARYADRRDSARDSPSAPALLLGEIERGEGPSDPIKGGPAGCPSQSLVARSSLTDVGSGHAPVLPSGCAACQRRTRRMEAKGKLYRPEAHASPSSLVSARRPSQEQAGMADLCPDPSLV